MQYDEKHAASGNLFEHYQDCSIFNCHSLHKRNAIYIRLKDDGSYVNNKNVMFSFSRIVYSQLIVINNQYL